MSTGMLPGDMRWLKCPNCGPINHVVGTERGRFYSECVECGHVNDEGPDETAITDEDLPIDDELHHVEPPC